MCGGGENEGKAVDKSKSKKINPHVFTRNKVEKITTTTTTKNPSPNPTHIQEWLS